MMMAAQRERSTAFYEREARDLSAWFRVARRDYCELIEAYDFNALFRRYDAPIRLLDIGCGTGVFPDMLRPKLHAEHPILYDYLDPAKTCLEVMESVLTTPFVPGDAFHDGVEDLQSGHHYDVIWALHSLWALPEGKVDSTLRRVLGHCKPSGVALIYAQAQRSSYSTLYKAYNNAVHAGSLPLYRSAEELYSAVQRTAAKVTVHKLCFEHRFRTDDEHLLEKYLQKNVLSPISLSEWRSHAQLDAILRDRVDGTEYGFDQEVWLIEAMGQPDRPPLPASALRAIALFDD